MKIFINDALLEIDPEHIKEHLEEIKQSLVNHYKQIDVLLRAGLKVASRKILDSLLEETGDTVFNAGRNDPNIHLIDVGLAHIVKFFGNVEVHISVDDNKKVTGVCIKNVVVRALSENTKANG